MYIFINIYILYIITNNVYISITMNAIKYISYMYSIQFICVHVWATIIMNHVCMLVNVYEKFISCHNVHVTAMGLDRVRTDQGLHYDEDK